MLTLHHLEYSQSFRVLWLLEELGVDYALKIYERDKKTRLAPEEYKAISPLGTAPVITDGDFALAETSAIVDYILDKHPSDQLRPPVNSPDRTRYLFWSHVAQGSIMPAMLIDVIFRIVQGRVPFFLKPVARTISNQTINGFIRPRMNALLKQAEIDLADTPWFGGNELTAADILLSYPMEGANGRGYITDSHVNCRAWLERVHARPGFQSAREKDGRPSIMLSL